MSLYCVVPIHLSMRLEISPPDNPNSLVIADLTAVPALYGLTIVERVGTLNSYAIPSCMYLRKGLSLLQLLAHALKCQMRLVEQGENKDYKEGDSEETILCLELYKTR